MKDEELSSLYRRALEDADGVPGSECPSPERLQAVAEGEAAHGERLSVMDHVSRCLRCQRDLALLGQVAGTRPRSRPSEGAMWLAAAATVVLAFVGLRVVGPWGGEAPVYRGDESIVTTVSPRGEVTAAAAGALVWRAVPDATRYEVEILTPDGEVVHVETVRDTTMGAPQQVTLPGSYRWRVTAVGADGTRTESALVSFTVTPDGG